MFILLYPHNMSLNHHLTVLTIIKHGIYAVLQEPPSQDPALKFVLRASMSQWCWQACSNQPSCLLYSRSLSSCQLMSVCHGIFGRIHRLLCLLSWLLVVTGYFIPVGWLRCNRPLLLPEVGSKPGSVREEPRPELVPCDPGWPWQSYLTDPDSMEAVDTFRIYKLQLATQSTRWGQTESIGSEVNGDHLPRGNAT